MPFYKIRMNRETQKTKRSLKNKNLREREKNNNLKNTKKIKMSINSFIVSFLSKSKEELSNEYI